MRKLEFLPIFLFVLAMGLSVRFVDFSRAMAEDAKPAAKQEDVKTEEKKDDKAADTKVDTKADAKPDAEAEAPKVSGDEPPPEDELNDTQIDVLKQLSDRRRALDLREKNLAQREAVVNAAQGELNQKYTELDKLRGEIKKLLDLQSEEEEKRLVSLVKVYEGMKPQSAATILNTLDTEVLMQVMGRMSDRKMSPILAAMDPNRAREVTINLALQKKLPDAAVAATAPDAPSAPAALPTPEAPPAQ